MLRFLNEFFFGCFHSRTTFPMTISRRSPENGEIQRRTYVTCLTCGEEIAYNWDKMQTEGSFHAASAPAPVVSVAHLTRAQASR